MHHLIEDSGLSPDSPDRKRRLVTTADGGRRWCAPYTNEGSGATMLDALKDACIFQVARSMHGRGFRVEEASENYEHVFLTPAQLYQLGTELHETAQSLVGDASEAITKDSDTPNP